MIPGVPYRRLPGRSGLFIRKRLWMGPDHLLLVTSNVLSEDYRRFYFSDIESIIIAQIENEARFYGGVLAVIAVVLTLGLIVSDHLVTAVLCGLIGAGLGIFTWTRPTVRCSIKTRVSREVLSSLKSLESARSVIERLRAEIEKAQGSLTRETFADRAHVPGSTVPPALTEYKGGVHYAAFASMFAVALLTPLRLNFPSTLLTNLFAGSQIVMLLLAIIAAVKQHHSIISRVARAVVALALTWAAASYVTEQGLVASTIRDAYKNPMRFQYWTDPIWDVAVANAVAYAVFGLIGVLALVSQQRPEPVK